MRPDQDHSEATRDPARDPRAARGLGVLALGLAMLWLPGCLERTIRVTSEPPGAIVWLNDVEIGQTPAEARFKFYGVYDVRLELPGYEPVHEGREAKAPFHEYPGPDLIASVVPARLATTIDWHYVLTPSPSLGTPDEEAAMIARARALRERLGPAPGTPPDEPGATGAGEAAPAGLEEVEARPPAPLIEPVAPASGGGSPPSR